VTELSSEQKKAAELTHGLVVTDVGTRTRGDLRRGDILLTLVYKGQQTDLTSVKQLNRMLARLDSSAVITLLVRRDQNTAFVTITKLADRN